MAKPLHAFAIDPVTHRTFWGNSNASWREPRVPEVTIPYFVGSAGDAVVRIKTEDGAILQAFHDEAERGLNYAAYDLSAAAVHAEEFNEAQQEEDEDATLLEAADNEVFYLISGKYTVEITLNGETVTETLEVKEPPSR